MLKYLTAAVAAAALALSAQPGSGQRAAGGSVGSPPALTPPGLPSYRTVPAKRVQVYTCGKNAAGAWAWNFKAPDAELFDTQQKKIGKHYAGPTWEGTDGG